MVASTEMIIKWVTRSAVANGCLIVVDTESELCTRFTYIIALSVTAFIASYQVNHIRCFA